MRIEQISGNDVFAYNCEKISLWPTRNQLYKNYTMGLSEAK